MLLTQLWVSLEFGTNLLSLCAAQNLYAQLMCFAEICSKEGVGSYPTFKFYRNGKLAEEYTGGREMENFVEFMEQQDKKTGSEETTKKDGKRDEL